MTEEIINKDELKNLRVLLESGLRSAISTKEFERVFDKIDSLEQENKELSFAIEKCLENAGIECDDEEQALRSLPMLGNAHYKVLVENKDFEMLAKSLYKRIEELEKENEALAFRERLYKADYEDSEQENKELKEKVESLKSEIRQKKMTIMMNNDHYLTVDKNNQSYRSALEEIREILKLYADSWVDEKIYPNLHFDNTKAKEGLLKINEVLNESK